jgi:hypothetical protein
MVCDAGRSTARTLLQLALSIGLAPLCQTFGDAIGHNGRCPFCADLESSDNSGLVR